jgi:hypothetical protein
MRSTPVVIIYVVLQPLVDMMEAADDTPDLKYPVTITPLLSQTTAGRRTDDTPREPQAREQLQPIQVGGSGLPRYARTGQQIP